MRRSILTGLAGFAAVIGFSILFSPSAFADACTPNGRDCDIGYFSGQNINQRQGLHQLYTPVNTGLHSNNINELVRDITNRLNCAAFNPNSQNAVSAAFTVLTMLGVPPGADKFAACQRLGEWTAVVRLYDSEGLIDYNVRRNTGGINTRASVAGEAPGVPTDVAYYEIHDDVDSIVFRDPANRARVIYAIKRLCGNPIGRLSSLVENSPRDCIAMTVSPVSPNPRDTIIITFGIDFKTSFNAQLWRSSGGKLSASVNGPGVAYNNADAFDRLDGRYVRGRISVGPTGQVGEYLVAWAAYGSSQIGGINCGGNTKLGGDPTFTVSYKPYFNVRGGDVSAGAAMQAPGASNECSIAANPKAGLVSWNTGPSGGYAGAGTNYAAMALGVIQGVASGQGSGYTPDGLTFANTDTNGNRRYGGTGDIYGGNFGGVGCVPNYFISDGAIKSNNYLLNNGNQLNVANGQHLPTIYVEGNVVIRNNVIFTGSGSYASIQDIPRFRLVVLGNIYIHPSVRQLDGVYIAQPKQDGTGGIVYTCAPDGTNTSLLLTKSLYSNCDDSPLTVNGAVIAKQLWMLRTTGNVGDAPAEQFNFVPEMWLEEGSPEEIKGQPGRYEALTALPPVL